MTTEYTNANAEVWVWLHRQRDRSLHPAVSELLYEAQGLVRRLEAGLVAVCDVPPTDEEAALLGRWGVVRVRTLGMELPPHPLIVDGTSPLAGLLEVRRPHAVLLLADTFGRVVAPLVAAECGATYVPGVTGVTMDTRHFVAARPTLGDQYEALVTLERHLPLVATLLPGAVGESGPRAEPARGLPVLEPPERPPATSPGDARLVPPDPETVDVADAERIVAFGRGAFHGEAVALVERLANALGATVAGTRPAADEGWLPFAKQVGLTGAIVRPKLYVAVGISGAPYHMVGVKEPETLIAINSDPEAPIFGAAHLGIVGNLFDVLPALLERLERGESLAAATRDGIRRQGEP